MSQLVASQVSDLTRDIQQNNIEFTKLCVRHCDTLKNILEDRLNDDEKHCLSNNKNLLKQNYPL